MVFNGMKWNWKFFCQDNPKNKISTILFPSTINYFRYFFILFSSILFFFIIGTILFHSILFYDLLFCSNLFFSFASFLNQWKMKIIGIIVLNFREIKSRNSPTTIGVLGNESFGWITLSARDAKKIFFSLTTRGGYLKIEHLIIMLKWCEINWMKMPNFRCIGVFIFFVWIFLL